MRNFFITLSLVTGFLYSECSDLDYGECLYWSYYCEWNEDTEECQEVGGGGGGDTYYGPYEFSSLSESDGLRNGPDYSDGVLFYPMDAEPPYGSIVLTPGWDGGGESMYGWAEFFASHGFIAMAISPNDQVNDSHQQRAEGLLDAIQSIKQEQWRVDSPLFGFIDTTRFIVSGYSMGGGASQIALTLDDFNVTEYIVGAIALNPTIIVEDCDVCADYEYCICLVPEFLEHDIPTIVIAGQNEIDELPSYDGLLGQDIYYNTPETTDKILYEISNGSHGSAAFPSGSVQEKALYWAKYHLTEDISYCDSLLLSPDDASLYVTTIDCSPSVAIDDKTIVPKDFILYQNYPNPFNPKTTIRYFNPKDSFIKITIHDVLGNMVINLFEGMDSPGEKNIIWNSKNSNGQSVPAGLYFYTVKADNFVDAKKMILLK